MKLKRYLKLGITYHTRTSTEPTLREYIATS